MRDLFPIDIKKLKDEDKRFLLEKSSSEFLFNEQMRLNNRMLMISVFALLASLLSLVISSPYNTKNQAMLFLDFIIILASLLIILFKKSVKEIRQQQGQLESMYNSLFRDYFNYAKR